MKKILLLIAILVLSTQAHGAGIIIGSGDTPADNYYVAPTGNDGNTCLTTGSACASEQGAVNKLPLTSTKNVIINVASGTYTPAATNGAALYIEKRASGNNLILIRGYVNSTSGQFTDVASDSGTSTGSNTNLFPINSTPTADYTYFYDTGKSWTTNQWAGKYLRITGGTGLYGAATFTNTYNWYLISDNTATRLNIIGRWSGSTPDATTTYEMYDMNNSPNITVGAANYCVYANRAQGVALMFMKCLQPTTRGLNIIDSDNISIYGAHILGGNNWIYNARRFTLNLTRLDVTDYGGDIPDQAIGFYSNTSASLSSIFITGFEGQGFYANRSIVDFFNAYIASTVTTAADEGVALNAGFYADVGSTITLGNTKIFGRNSAAFSNDVLVATFNTHIQLQRNVLLSGFDTSANTYGPTISHHSTMESLYGPVLVTGVWKGNSVTNSSFFSSIVDFSYSNIGAGGNETIEGNSVKDNAIH